MGCSCFSARSYLLILYPNLGYTFTFLHGWAWPAQILQIEQLTQGASRTKTLSHDE